jgi:predicted glycosyltransferase
MKRLSEGEYLIIDNDNFIVMRPNQFEASYKKI